MLSLKKTSPVVRYAFWWSDKYAKTGPPDAVSLCELFWRCVPPTATFAGATAFVIAMVYAAREAIYHPPPARPVSPVPWEVRLCWLLLALFFGGWMGALLVRGWIEKYPDGWLATVVYAIKGRICPRIALAGVTPFQVAEQERLRLRHEREMLVLTALQSLAATDDAAVDEEGDLVITLRAEQDLITETLRVADHLAGAFPAAWDVYGDYTFVRGARVFAALPSVDEGSPA